MKVGLTGHREVGIEQGAGEYDHTKTITGTRACKTVTFCTNFFNLHGSIRRCSAGQMLRRARHESANGSSLKSLALVLAVVIYLLHPRRSGAETLADYKYEVYAEDRDRIQVRTHSALFEQSLVRWLSLKGSYVHDAISGATPTGGPPPPGSQQVPLASMHDDRQAGYIEPRFQFGPHLFAPQVAYSSEDDYESLGLSLNYVRDFNEKNTTLNLGLAHNFDRLTGYYLRQRWERKESTDFLVGVSQVLTPTTLFNVTLTLGTAHGYLSDPYKGFWFSDYPELFPERRPRHRTKQILSASLNQHVEPLRGSAELSYRFYHDSHGIVGHTTTLEWFQKIGSHVVVAPLLRFYSQSAADFYRLSFAADPSDPENPANALIPPFYSADYRVSALRTWTYGITATVRLGDRLFFDAAYKRYEMIGRDAVTAASNYPSAHIYTVGLRLHF